MAISISVVLLLDPGGDLPAQRRAEGLARPGVRAARLLSRRHEHRAGHPQRALRRGGGREQPQAVTAATDRRATRHHHLAPPLGRRGAKGPAWLAQPKENTPSPLGTGRSAPPTDGCARWTRPSGARATSVEEPPPSRLKASREPNGPWVGHFRIVRPVCRAPRPARAETDPLRRPRFRRPYVPPAPASRPATGPAPQDRIAADREPVGIRTWRDQPVADLTGSPDTQPPQLPRPPSRPTSTMVPAGTPPLPGSVDSPHPAVPHRHLVGSVLHGAPGRCPSHRWRAPGRPGPSPR